MYFDFVPRSITLVDLKCKFPWIFVDLGVGRQQLRLKIV